MLTVGLNVLGNSPAPGFLIAASICGAVAFVHAASTGLFWKWPVGQAVSGWCLAMAILSTRPLLACVCICRCATCCSSAIGAEVYNQWVHKHS